jgi:spore coat polysaccharide biosynthesis protein SpsF
MRIVAIIQARMGSTRLPGKVLMPLAGREVISHVVSRVSACNTIADVVVATSTDTSDDALEKWCEQNEIKVFRGSLNDVLDRYHMCALWAKADAVVRITADCPALDPILVDEVVLSFAKEKYDLFYLGGEFPDGLDCAVFSVGALARACREAKLSSEREHVGPYISNHPELFKIGHLDKYQGLSHHRWTLDEPRDLIFLQAIFDRLNSIANGIFHVDDVLNLLKNEPELMAINGGIVRNEGLLKSIASEAVQ